MNENTTKAPGWRMILATMIGVGLVAGLLFGLMGDLLGLSPTVTTGGVGASVGLAGAILIARRRATIDRQKKH